jgi:hypothetical protein
MANLSSKPPPEEPAARGAAPNAAVPAVDPGSVRRALIVRPRYVGDVCLTLPVLDHVRPRSTT